VLICLLNLPFCFSQESKPSAQMPDNALSVSFAIALDKSLDSKKLKEGDAVVGTTTGTVRGRDGFLIPSGSKVTGHVTKAEARSSGGSDSLLGLAFDSIEPAKGKKIPINGKLQAIAPGLGSPGPYMGAENPQLASKGGGGSSAAPTSSMQVTGPANGTAVLTPTSQGVLGVKGLQMDPNGVLESGGKEVKLDHGMQLLVHADIQLPEH